MVTRKKYLAVLLSLLMVFTCILPAMAGTDQTTVTKTERAGSRSADVVKNNTTTSGGLVVQNMVSKEDLVNSLLGGGVTVSNISYTGTNESAGKFTGGTSIIGFESGVILSSGYVQNVVGPNQQDGITGENNTNGDSDLDALIPGYTTEDATILEFDFVPVSSYINFQYVFASDEYNEYVNDVYNDVFGFFLNGQNVALTPGTNDRVSINSINGGNPLGTNSKNSQFYRNNDLDDGGGTINTEMDGLTTVLTVRAQVNQGVSNHIKLAIADAGDASLDSNVFIKTGSFRSDQPGQFQFSQSGYEVAENGGSATITVNRTDGSDGAVTVDYATGNGTATAGYDYTAASGTLTFAEGETSKTFTVSIIDDALTEENETVNLTLSNPTGGAVLGVQGAAVLTINDNDIAPTVSVSINNNNVPTGTNVTATATVTGITNPVYQFYIQSAQDGTWTNSGDYSSSNSFTFTKSIPGTYTVIAYAKAVEAPASNAVQSAPATVTFTGRGVSSLDVTGPEGSRPVGSSATFTATATVYNGIPLYQFWLRDRNTTEWRVVQDYSENNSYTLYDLQPGSYVIAVYCLDSEDFAAQNWSAAYYKVFILNVGSSVSLNAPGSVAVGGTVNLTAQAVGLTQVEYQFWYKTPDGVWHQTDYSPGNTFSFTVAAPGNYPVAVYAKDHYAPNSADFSVSATAMVSCQ